MATLEEFARRRYGILMLRALLDGEPRTASKLGSAAGTVDSKAKQRAREHLRDLGLVRIEVKPYRTGMDSYEVWLTERGRAVAERLREIEDLLADAPSPPADEDER